MIDIKGIRARTCSDGVLRVALIAVLAGIVSLGALPAFASPPANDDCAGAIVIPAGAYPVATTPVDITQATPSGSADPVISCSTPDRTIWYSFTPSVSATYVISTCAGSGATGSTVYDSVLGVFDSTGAACPQGASLGCNDTDPACTSAIPGAPYVDQATVEASLVAGHTYYVVAGHSTFDAGGVTPAHSQIAIVVDIVPPPANDTCSAPVPLQLDRVTTGTTVAAHDDYQSPNTTACFAGVGQTPTSSPGADVVFSFTAPAAGSYSFRYVQDNPSAALRSQNPVLYAAGTCPPSGTVSCLKGANRILVNGAANGNRSEEIDCLPMTGGQTVYVFFDDGASGNAAGPLAIEVHACNAETEPNDTTATANAYSACYMTGATNPTGDVDFFDLGAPPAGSKVFAALDAVATNNSDYELRVTTSTDTLQYDDNDGSSQIGTNSAVIAGTPTTGAQTFLRVNHKAAGSPAEPYHLYARVETGLPQPEVDTPSNDSAQSSNLITGGGFVSGVRSSTNDLDCFHFLAREGDDIGMFANNNPSRAAGTIFDALPVLLDLIGAPPTNFAFAGGVLRNILTPSPGTLTGVTPSITSNFWDYRARYTGTYFVCFVANNSTPNVPRPYEGSISLNCGPIPAPASHVTDVAVAVAGPAGPVNTGGFVDYTITLNNTGADYAQDVRVVDTLPTQMVFLSMTINDGYSGLNTGCNAPPTPGAAGATIDCTNFSLAPGASTTITIHTQVGNCSAVGANVHNVASITTASTDTNAANNAASRDFTTSTDGTCEVLVCDGVGCLPNLCALSDHCEGSVCVSTPVNCDDGNSCTDDVCAPATGACAHASNDNNTCSDGDLCTQTDTCHAGVCGGADIVACGVTCPAGFISVAGGCRKTYDIDLSLLDDVQPFCDNTGTIVAGQTIYGFHWSDLGGSLPAVTRVDVQLEAGIKCTNGPNTLTLNGVAAGGFNNLVGACSCPPPHQTISLLNLDVGAYAKGGLNVISITPGTSFGNASEGLNASSNLGGNFARVAVTYLPTSQTGGPCTLGTCDAGTGTCSFANLPDGTVCGDASACTESGTCQSGVCIGAVPVTCNAPPACHTAVGAVCVMGTGACVYPTVPNGSSCSDGIACTVGDTCQSGTCAPGTATCTALDQCHVAGTCDPGTGTCSNPSAPNGAFCNDGNACTQTDTCQSGTCMGTDPVTCYPVDQCHVVGTCDPARGTCSNPNAADGTTCTDGNACTVGDTCHAATSGAFPQGTLIQGMDGALYGTTSGEDFQFGSQGYGTVFKMNRDGSGYSVLHIFDSVGGAYPVAGLTQGTDGVLYGATQGGGSGGDGTLFKMNPDGSGFTVLKNFQNSILSDTGAFPLAPPIQGRDGALYGTAELGPQSFGEVFKLNTDGTGFTLLKDFGNGVEGMYPIVQLIQGVDGALYGAAEQGGSLGYGTVFKLNTDGTGFTILKYFDLSTTGGGLDGRLLQGRDGVLYGTTAGDITTFFRGSVFKLNTDGTGFAILKEFDYSNTGISLSAGLVQGTDGALYGTALQGGSQDYGTVFKLNPDGTGFTVLKNFDSSSTGGYLYAGLVQGTDGALYGAAENGGSEGGGTLFKLNPNGTGFTVLKNLSFDPEGACTGTSALNCDDGNPCTDDACNPISGCFHSYNTGSCDDGNACTVGDTCQEFSTGRFPYAGLVQGTDGALYGSTAGGGSSGYGTVFKLNPDGTGFRILKDLVDFSAGAYVRATLLQGAGGVLYGVTQQGGTIGNGAVFKLNADGTGYTVLKSFDYLTTGAGLDSKLIQGTGGALYGTAAIGGSGGYGTVFKLNPDGTGFTVLKNFDNSTAGGTLYGGVIQGADGALYGAAEYVGSGGYGTLFKLNPDGTGFTVLKNFDGSTTGGNPTARLLQGANGALYGTTFTGGASGYGTLFKLNPDGTGFTVLKNFDGSTTGGNPIAGLIQGADGALYGTTENGGSVGYGTVFKLNPDGTDYIVLKNFDDSGSGSFLQAALIQGTDGTLYGTAAQGGSHGVGTVFKLNPDGTGFTLLHIFSVGLVSSCTAGAGTLNCDDNNPCTDDSCNSASGCVHTNNTAPCDDGNSSTLGDTCGGGICHAGTNLPAGPKFLKAKLIDGDIKDPSKVVLVDLDGDGRPDLLAAIGGDGTPGSSRIIWRRNLGKAGFDLVWGPQQIISIAPYIVSATGVAAVDVDGDGLLDVVSSDRSATPFTDGKIAWYRNLGGGNFGDPATNQLSVSTTPPNQANAVQAADIDRDGRMDLVSASQTDSRIVWYQNLPASPTRCGTANVGSGLRGWWPGDWFIADWVEGHRGAVDISGYGNTGNMYYTDFVPGVVGEGFKFYGTVENYIDQIGTPASYSFVQNTGVFTIDTWIKLQDPNSLARQPIMGNGQGGLVKGFLLLWENLGGEQSLRFFGFKGAPEYLDFQSPHQILTDTNWHHVAVVGNGTTVTFYVDGTAYPGSGTTGAPNPTGDSSALLMIGPSFGPGIVFNGMMDEVQIWDRALGAAEIQAIVAAGSKGSSTCNEPGGIKWVQHEIFDLAYYFPYANTIHHTFRNIALTDIDRDGDLDVVWASGPDAGGGSTWTPFAWLENTDGAGTFGPPNSLTPALVDGRSAVTADIDGDGIEDVVTATCDAGLAWHHYDGSPAPGAFVNHTPFGPPTCTAAVAAADLDGDGKLDVLSAGNTGATWYHQDPITLGAIPFQAIPLDGPASSAHDIHAVDLDGDGDLDIVAAYDSTSQLVWFENPTVHSTASFGPERVVNSGLVPFSTAVAGDFDRDGHPDIVCGGNSGDLELFQNRVTGLQWGSSWLEQGPYIGQSSSPSRRNLSVADLDRDGKLDIVYAGAGQPPLLFRGADRVGSQWPFTTIGSGIASTAAAVGDFDGDGDSDVVVGVVSGANGVIHGYANIDGHGTLTTAFPDIPINSGASGVLDVPSVALGDLNGDGKPDLIAATLESPNAGRVCWFRGNGTSFDSTQTNLNPSAAVRSLAVGDLDGDGKLDVVMASSAGITWFHNAGDGIAGSLNPVASTSQPVDSIALADLDGDGDLDVVTASALDTTLGWYENIGGLGLFGPRQPVVTSSPGSRSVAIADLDGDGTPDLIASSASPGARFAVYPNLRAQYSVSGTSIAPATAPSGQRVPLLAVTIRTHARPGDPACELQDIAFDMLANPSSSPLTGSEAATLFSGFELYRDANGSGSFDAGDLLISSAPTAPSISFSPSPGDPEARLAAPATFLLVAQMASTAGNTPPTHFAARFASVDVVDTLPGALTPLTSTPQPALVTGLLTAQGAIHVDTASDVVNAGDGLTSLREAIILANATPGGRQIFLTAGTYTLGIAGKGEDGSLTGDLDLTNASGAVIITGVDAAQTIVDAGGVDRVFDVLPGASAVFENLTIQGGANPVVAGSGSGGGLRVGVGSFATLNHCVVSGNTATQGGAIQNGGDLTVDGSSVSNNVATATGGGIVNTSVLRLRNSLVSNNQAADHGGISNSGTLTVENSTLTGNAANLGGGGNDAGALGNTGSATLVSSTITGNLATVHGGVSTSGPGTTTLKSTILAGNQGSLAPDCNGTVLSQGYNLIGNTTGCTISNPGSLPDRLNVGAFLTPLQDNGGPTLTEMPLLGSPALDAGSCAGSSFTTDQRGFPRVVDQPSVADASDGCDIGAVESPLTRTLTQISIPVRWCAVQGTPSIGSNQSLANSVLLSRTAKASKGIFEPEAGIKFVSGATPLVQNFFILPDPVTSPGSSPGDVFIDPETRNFDEFTQLINACRDAWQAQDPSVVGVTAVHINHFVDATGAPTDLLGLGGRADLGNSGEQAVAGRLMVIDSAYRASANPPDLVDRLLGHELGHASLALEHGNGIDDDHNGIVDDGDDARADLPTFDGTNLMQYRNGTDLTEAQVLQGRLHALNTIPDLTVTTSVDSNPVPIDPAHAQILDFGHAQILDFGQAQILDFGQAQILDFGHAQILDFGHAQILDFGHAQILDFGMDVSKATSSNTTEFFTSVAGLPWPISVRTDTSYFYYLDLDNNDATGGKPSSFGFPPTGGAEDPGIDLIAKVVNSTNGNTLTVFKYVASTPNFVQVTVPCDPQTTVGCGFMEPISVGLYQDTGGAAPAHDDVVIGVNVKVNLPNTVLTDAAPAWTPGTRVGMETMTSVNCDQQVQAIDPNTGEPLVANCNRCSTLTCSTPGCEHAPGCSNGAGTPITLADPSNVVVQNVTAQLAFVPPVLPHCVAAPGAITPGGSVSVSGAGFPAGLAGQPVDLSLGATLLGVAALDGAGNFPATPITIPTTVTPSDVVLVATLHGKANSGDCKLEVRELLITESLCALDTQTPAFTSVPAPVVVNTDPGVCTATLSLPAATATDNCDTAPLITSNAPAVFPLGLTTVTFTAQDASGNIATATTTVTVNDHTAPTLTITDQAPQDVGANVVVTCTQLNSSGIGCARYDNSGIVSWLASASATDACSTPTITNNAQGSFTFLRGLTTVAFTATDAAGNSTTKTGVVRVIYNFGGFEPPLLSNGSAVITKGKQGRTIPVKFKLTCGGTPVTTAVATIVVHKIIDTATGTVDTTNLTDPGTAGDNGNLFHYDPSTQEYVFNLSTKPFSAPATYQVQVILDDGTDPVIYGHLVNFSVKP